MAEEGDEVTPAAVLLAQLLGGAGAGVVATALTGDPYAGIVAGGTGQVALQAAVERLVASRWAKAGRMAGYAADRAERDVVDLLDTIIADAALLELLGITVEAAMRAIGERKLRTLGGSLASGALSSDDATIHVEMQIAKALADLEAPHLRVLLFYGRTGGLASLSDLENAETLQHLGRSFEPLVAVLRAHGLLEAATATTGLRPPGPIGVGRGWSMPSSDKLYMTPFGRLVLTRYSEAGGDGEAGEP